MARRNGAYAPLSNTYYLDDAVIEAGEKAEVLFTRMLAFCSSVPSDGYITDGQLVRVGAGLSGIAQRAQRLVDCGLCERLPGGYQIRSWLKWNKSASEMERVRSRDRERKAAQSDEGFQPELVLESVRNPSGTGGGIRSGSEPRADAREASARTTTQHNTTRQGTGAAESAAKRATRAPESFDVDDGLRSWAHQQGLTDADITRETPRWLDHHRAKGSTFKDWRAAWRTWMSRVTEYAPRRPLAVGSDAWDV